MFGWRNEPMMKGVGYGGGDDNTRSYSDAPLPTRSTRNLIARVGEIKAGSPSRNATREHTESIPKIDDDILGYNIDGKMCLLRLKQNDRKFDNYVALPFTKGVTERNTGRTILILGSTAHHGEVMVGQFEGVIWTPEMIEKEKSYGNTIRWINVGDTREGFIGLDYNPQASQNGGVATSLEDIEFLSKSLIEFGYNPEKKIFLLKPPFVVESMVGRTLRNSGYKTLKDFLRK